jgi:hypothetical protein
MKTFGTFFLLHRIANATSPQASPPAERAVVGSPENEWLYGPVQAWLSPPGRYAENFTLHALRCKNRRFSLVQEPSAVCQNKRSLATVFPGPGRGITPIGSFLGGNMMTDYNPHFSYSGQ